MIKVVGFDLDGTVADTIPLSIDVLKKVVLDCTGKFVTDEDIYETFGMNEEGMLEALVGKRHVKRALENFHHEYALAIKKKKIVFKGIKEFIIALRKSGIITVLITGRGKVSGMLTLESLGLVDCFDEVMFGDRNMNIKAEQLKVVQGLYDIEPNELIYIGDSVSDVYACTDANVRCFSVAWREGHEHEILCSLNKKDIYTDLEELGAVIFQQIKY